MPLLDTPELRQRDGHSCGAVAFDILYRFHHGGKAPRWTQELPDPARGMGPDTLELLVRKHFDNVVVGHIDLRTLKWLSSFTPTLCLVRIDHELDHWTVVRAVTRSKVHTQDPDEGRKHYSHEEWVGMWTDAASGGAFVRYAVAGWPAA